MSKEACRAEFEAKLIDDGWVIPATINGEYIGNPNVTTLWHWWQAAWQARDTAMKEGVDWQPIATAPRDGTHILAFNPDKEEPEVTWYANTTTQWKWQTWENGYVEGWCEYWMLLPNPPLPTKQKDADYPECSGDSDSCPENEGYGCCAKFTKQKEGV